MEAAHLTQIGTINIILVNTPKQSNGVSLGCTTLLYLIGTSVGPVLAGIFMQDTYASRDIHAVIEDAVFRIFLARHEMIFYQHIEAEGLRWRLV